MDGANKQRLFRSVREPVVSRRLHTAVEIMAKAFKGIPLFHDCFALLGCDPLLASQLHHCRPSFPKEISQRNLEQLASSGSPPDPQRFRRLHRIFHQRPISLGHFFRVHSRL
ncbi:hypothetical protein L596_006953 [Steinernema carpocapsae]|uniref:Uncharacterized protein n=1 Tax=Steinernema carpocapsae TaxID=34508 RepID=A0A4U5P8H1_STECR|nr:hypothetical protein L596_006953 [Steinernema carpocapsae]